MREATSRDLYSVPDLYPLLLRPELHRRVWGGERLPALYGPEVTVRGQPGEPVGESWLLDAASVVTNGPFEGRTLSELAGELGAHLVGSEAYTRYGPRMPLLLKLLDAAQPLSVQVHPNDAYALEHEAATGHLGKSEAWYVLEAAAGSTVLWGLQEPVTADQLQRAAADGGLPDLMHSLPVSAGSVVVNPPGTLHAVGAGILLFEIQQSSDLTYRIYDYGRLGADGHPRELHLDKAAAVADLTGTPPKPVTPLDLGDGWRRLVQRPEFVLDKLVLTGPGGKARERGVPSGVPDGVTSGASHGVTGRVAPTSLETLTVIEGEVTLALQELGDSAGTSDRPQATLPSGPVRLGFGETVLLPAGLARPYTLAGAGVVLRGAVVKEPA